jgi:hypothetical protein
VHRISACIAAEHLPTVIWRQELTLLSMTVASVRCCRKTDTAAAYSSEQQVYASVGQHFVLCGQSIGLFLPMDTISIEDVLIARCNPWMLLTTPTRFTFVLATTSLARWHVCIMRRYALH